MAPPDPHPIHGEGWSPLTALAPPNLAHLGGALCLATGIRCHRHRGPVSPRCGEAPQTWPGNRGSWGPEAVAGTGGSVALGRRRKLPARWCAWEPHGAEPPGASHRSATKGVPSKRVWGGFFPSPRWLASGLAGFLIWGALLCLLGVLLDSGRCTKQGSSFAWLGRPKNIAENSARRMGGEGDHGG